MRFQKFINESISNTLIMVDIQPAHKNSIYFNYRNLFKYISEFQNIHVFYNGEDLEMDSKHNIIDFYIEQGCKEKIIERMTFFEKNYAFFRDLMDHGLDEEKIIQIGKLLLRVNKNDWRELIKDELQELNIDLDPNHYGFNIPDVLFEIKKLPNNCILIGGGREECLKEVELCFHMLNKSYQLNNQFIY